MRPGMVEKIYGSTSKKKSLCIGLKIQQFPDFAIYSRGISLLLFLAESPVSHLCWYLPVPRDPSSCLLVREKNTLYPNNNPKSLFLLLNPHELPTAIPRTSDALTHRSLPRFLLGCSAGPENLLRNERESISTRFWQSLGGDRRAPEIAMGKFTDVH